MCMTNFMSNPILKLKLSSISLKTVMQYLSDQSTRISYRLLCGRLTL